MPTNDSKLLRKVLSKWAFDELPDDKYNKGQIAIRIAEIKEMLLDMESAARSEGYKKGQRDTAKQIFKELDKQVEIGRLRIGKNAIATCGIIKVYRGSAYVESRKKWLG